MGGNSLYVNARTFISALIEGEDMKRKILYGSFLLMIVALISIRLTLLSKSPVSGGRGCEEQPIAVLNPAISSAPVERLPLAPRLETLEGKTLYLVDMQWGGPNAGYSVFEEMQAWFSRSMPSVKIMIKRMSSGPFGDDPALRREIVDKKVDGVITGVAG
jgi:hypothetical protein